MMKSRFVGCAFLLLAGWLSPGMAVAQPTNTASLAGPQLAPEQMAAFADLTGDTPHRITQRLASDPNLARLAGQAADARMSRKRAGKVMAIVGFTVLGVGDIVGTAIVISTPGYPNVEKGHEGRILLGLGIGVGALAVGLALAIPGLVKMAKASDVENQALELYAPGSLDEPEARRLWPEPRSRLAFADRAPAFTTQLLTIAF
jgi:hypothetical protein